MGCLLGWGGKASTASKLAYTDEIKHNPDTGDADKQIRPEIYFTLKIAHMLLQKGKHERESNINTSAVSLYTVYCFILNVESKDIFFTFYFLFCIIQKSSSIWNRRIEKNKTIIFTQKEGMRSFIQFCLFTFESVNEWSLSRDKSKFIKPVSLMYVKITNV